jgi:hypothetical protein
MKKVLILAIGCQKEPWDVMMQTSLDTWDSINVDGVETIFYFGNPVKENTSKCIYFPVVETYNAMGEKMMRAFEWVLQNKEFDYVARVNSSCYVDKKRLIEYIQTLPDNNVFAGLTIKGGDDYKEDWLWGGGQFIISRDVVQKFVDNKEHLRHDLMEDVAISFLANKLEIPFYQGRACSIDNAGNDWICVVYGGGETFIFNNWEDVKLKSNEHFYRVKQDSDRSIDKLVMENLFKTLT